MKPKKKKVNAWIARDKNGILCLFLYKKPFLLDGCIWVPQEEKAEGCAILDKKDFPDVTFENSPFKITITTP